MRGGVWIPSRPVDGWWFVYLDHFRAAEYREENRLLAANDAWQMALRYDCECRLPADWPEHMMGRLGLGVSI